MTWILCRACGHMGAAPRQEAGLAQELEDLTLLGSQGCVTATAWLPKVRVCQQWEAAHDFPSLCGIAED